MPPPLTITHAHTHANVSHMISRKILLFYISLSFVRICIVFDGVAFRNHRAVLFTRSSRSRVRFHKFQCDTMICHDNNNNNLTALLVDAGRCFCCCRRLLPFSHQHSFKCIKKKHIRCEVLKYVYKFFSYCLLVCS